MQKLGEMGALRISEGQGSKTVGRRAELQTFHRLRQHGQLLTEREGFRTIARCPPQISPIDRRSTISAVSMRDPLVGPTRKSTSDIGARIGERQAQKQKRNHAILRHHQVTECLPAAPSAGDTSLGKNTRETTG